MAGASSPGIGVARGASPVVMDSAVVWASQAAMSFVGVRSAGEVSTGTISGAARLAARALRGTIASAAERRAFDHPVGSLTAEEDGARVADTRVADTPAADTVR